MACAGAAPLGDSGNDRVVDEVGLEEQQPVRNLLKTFGLVLSLAASAGAGQAPDSPAAYREAALKADAVYASSALPLLDEGLKKYPNDPGLLAAKA